LNKAGQCLFLKLPCWDFSIFIVSLTKTKKKGLDLKKGLVTEVKVLLYIYYNSHMFLERLSPHINMHILLSGLVYLLWNKSGEFVTSIHVISCDHFLHSHYLYFSSCSVRESSIMVTVEARVKSRKGII